MFVNRKLHKSPYIGELSLYFLVAYFNTLFRTVTLFRISHSEPLLSNVYDGIPVLFLIVIVWWRNRNNGWQILPKPGLISSRFTWKQLVWYKWQWKPMLISPYFTWKQLVLYKWQWKPGLISPSFTWKQLLWYKWQWKCYTLYPHFG